MNTRTSWHGRLGELLCPYVDTFFDVTSARMYGFINNPRCMYIASWHAQALYNLRDAIVFGHNGPCIQDQTQQTKHLSDISSNYALRFKWYEKAVQTFVVKSLDFWSFMFEHQDIPEIMGISFAMAHVIHSRTPNRKFMGCNCGSAVTLQDVVGVV